MTKIICTQQPDVILHHHHQSLTFIIFEGISRISMELQRVLSNRRDYQACFLSFNLQLSELPWRFIVDILQVEEHEAVKVNTFSSLSGRDLSTTRVKVRTPCKVLRLEDRDALLRLISLFGISSVVGLRKRPPRVCQLKQNDTSVSAREGALRSDKINLIDTTKNIIRPQRKFKFNTEGRKGIDFIFFPEQSSLKITVRYASFVLNEALNKLWDLNITRRQVNNGQNRRLTDEELDELLANPLVH
jgi:hypothetical protein